jgi:hypothetical protein
LPPANAASGRKTASATKIATLTAPSCNSGAGFEADPVAEAFEVALEIGNGAGLGDLVEMSVSQLAVCQSLGERRSAA